MAVGRVGLVSGGYGESWTFGKTDLQGNIIYSVAKGAPWKIVVNVTAAEFSNVTIGLRLVDNIKTFVNVTDWYDRTITEFGGWVNNSTSGTYYWNSSMPVTRREKVFGSHPQEQWIWIPHSHVVNVTNSFWNFTSQKNQLVNGTQTIMDEWLFLIYDHNAQQFSLKEGYQYSSYDAMLRQQRQFLVLQALNTSDPTTGFYNLNLTSSSATKVGPTTWRLEFVGSFNSSILTTQDQYWIQPPTVTRRNGQQLYADWQHMSWDDFNIAVDKTVAITKLFDSKGHLITGNMFQVDPSEPFTVQSLVQGALKLYNDLDAVGIRLRASQGTWSPNASYSSNIEIKLILNRKDGTLSSETYNNTERSLYSYGLYKAWVQVDVIGFHNEYNSSSASWEWVNSTFKQMNYTTIEGWHWNYYTLNQTAYALNPSGPSLWIDRTQTWLPSEDPAFKVTPSYASLTNASLALKDGNVVSTLQIVFNGAAPQTCYNWELIFGNLTFNADYSQGWGEHRVTEWTNEPQYYVNSTQTGGQKWYVSQPSQPYSTTYNGTMYKVYEAPYIVFGDPASGTKELIQSHTSYDYGRLEDKTQYLLSDQWDPVTQTQLRYYELINGTKVYVTNGYRAVIRDLTLNCTDAYVLVGGVKTYLPNQTVVSTFMDRAQEDWAKQYWDPVHSISAVPVAYQLLNGTLVYRDSYNLWNGTHSYGFEMKNWNSTLNRWVLSSKAYSENSTSLMVGYGGKAVFLNGSICVPLRSDGSWWQSVPGGNNYYLVMKNGSRLFYPNPFSVDDSHRIISVDGRNYTLSWPDDYYTIAWEGAKLSVRGGGQGYVMNFYYVSVNGSMYEMPYLGASASSWWDLENLMSSGGKIPTGKSIKIAGVVYPIFLENNVYYIVKDDVRQPVGKPQINPSVFYSTIDGQEFWNVTQTGWSASYGTYNMRTNQLDNVLGIILTKTGYDAPSLSWTNWNKYGEDRENSTRYLLTPSGERIDVYEGRYLCIWPVTVGGVTYYTMDSSIRTENVLVGNQNVWKQYFTTIDGIKIYFDGGSHPPSWGSEIHVELPGMNYTRLVPYQWENRSVLDKTYIYNVTISLNRYILDSSGRLIPNGTALQIWGTQYGPGVQIVYNQSGSEVGRGIAWDGSVQANYMALLNGSRIYGNRTAWGWSYNFGWNGTTFTPEARQFNYSGQAFSATEGGNYMVLVQNGTWRRSVFETATQWMYQYPSYYVILRNGSRLDFEDKGFGEIEPGKGWFGLRLSTVSGGSLYWVEFGNRIGTFYNVTYGNEIARLYDQNMLVSSIYRVPRVLSEIEKPSLWLNVTSDKILVNDSKAQNENGYYYLVGGNGTELTLSAVNTWWTLSEKVRKEVFNSPQTPPELRSAYPRYNVTINGQEYYVIDPSPSRIGWQPGNIWDNSRYPSTFQSNGTTYPISYNQGGVSWRSYSSIILNGTKYELQDHMQWKAVYSVPINGVSNLIRVASENIFKEHTTWGPAYTWMLTNINVQTVRSVMNIVLGTPAQGMWGVKAFATVPETGAVDLDGNLDTTNDQYYVRRVNVNTDTQNRTIDRMWVQVTWDPNASKPGDEMHVSSWMGKVHNSWSFSWNESYIWYYASNMTTVSQLTMKKIKSTLVNDAGIPNPGYWDISRMATNMTSQEALAKAQAQGWIWMTDNSHEWEWIWFGTRQDFRTSWNESSQLKSAGIGLQYEYAGLILYNDANNDAVMQQSETTHFFMPSKVGSVSFASPGEEYGNYNDTGSLRLNVTDRVNFGVTFNNVNGTLFPYEQSRPRDMWGWWGGTIYGADFKTPNLNNMPTETSIDEMQFAVHFNATTTSGNQSNNEAQMKIDERYGQWVVDPGIIDGRTKLIDGNMSTYLRGMETLQNRSLAASWYVIAFTDTAWSVKDESGSQVSPDAVTTSNAFDVGSSLTSAKFATLKMGGTYDWLKPVAVNDTVRTLNVSSYTTPIGTFRQSYVSDSGKSSCGFGISASMYFLTVGFKKWDGAGVYHDPEISTAVSKVAYSSPGPGPMPQGEKTLHQITVNGTVYTIEITSTSTVSNVTYGHTSNEIVFTVEGPEGTQGSTTVAIPKALSRGVDRILAYLDSVPDSRSVTTNGTSWIVSLAYNHSSHSVRIGLDAPRAGSTLTCDAVPASIVKGLTIIISGSLTPRVSGAEVTIQVSADNGNTWSNVTTVRTGGDGTYSFDWRPFQARAYMVRATWSGDLLYLGAASVSKTVTVTEGSDYTMGFAMAAVGLVAVAAFSVVRRRKK
ncbi:Ig-like domain-containing protein [Candidatus Bathyarchaeota archaeon]|nr:Ig-like domain-containing protein [Candidatus Bathyarchaeota archaeon]